MGVRLFSARNALEASSSLPPAAARSGDRPDGPRFHGRLLEAAALLLFSAAAFLALSLASYRIDPFDPALSGADLAGATVHATFAPGAVAFLFTFAFTLALALAIPFTVEKLIEPLDRKSVV